MTGMIKIADPDNPGSWIDTVGGMGPTGVLGVTGPLGPTGPRGPMRPSLNEIHVGPAVPTDPDAEIWYDTVNEHVMEETTVPDGGTTDQLLAKKSHADSDVEWSGPHLKLTGGALSGDLTVNQSLTTDILQVPTINGDTDFANWITANKITDRSSTQFQTWDVNANLHSGWHTWDGGPEHGDSKVYCNQYIVVISLCLRCSSGRDESIWITPFSAKLPTAFRPAYPIWQTRMSTEDHESGSLFEMRIEPDGGIHVQECEATITWNEWTAIPIHFTFPRAFA